MQDIAMNEKVPCHLFISHVILGRMRAQILSHLSLLLLHPQCPSWKQLSPHLPKR